ncbi:MAG TPA: hypothetical protein VMD91_05020 [Candidatus Sulfotelmatobacter sp.]|nr:hypothetical protein [Candidatus Sulfotelmatobacter sp.]
MKSLASAALVAALSATLLSGCSSSGSAPAPRAPHMPAADMCYTPQTTYGAKTWYVSAAATTSGNGTLVSPFNSLAAVQAASHPGDTIAILASPAGTAPLNGGIVLQSGQQLVGAGPAVLAQGAPAMTGSLPLVGSSGASSLPEITNTTTANNGDAVELANYTSVYNVVVAGASRGGIYGSNVTGVCVQGNDVSGTNTSQTVGFVVLPFYLESYTAGAATHASLNAGWAAIMVDESSGTAAVAIDGNYVHNGSCSDGIDLRSMGTAIETAQVNGNFVSAMPQCSAVRTIEGIGAQANVNGALTISLFGNTEENNGSSGANADSVFVNEGGSGQLNETIAYNYYNTGIGGASTNGMEFIVGDGTNEVGNVTISNSTFINDPGDMLEEYNRGTGSQTTLTLDNVTVQGTTISGGLPSYADPAGTATTPDNTGECLGVASVGAGNQTILKLDNTVLQNCGNNGIEVTNNHPTAQGAGSPALFSLDLENSAIINTKYYGVWMNTVTPLQTLQIKAANTLFMTSTNGVLLGFDNQPTGGTTTSAVDLGGGSLGSGGNNCILNGSIYGLEATSYDVSANSDWWGSPAGPAPGTVSVTPSGYSASTASPLATEPAFCTNPI